MKKILFICIVLLMICSCQKRHKNESVKEKEHWIEFSMLYDDSSNLMRHVYVDKTGCLHVSKKCGILDSIYQINYIDTGKLSSSHYKFYCATCVNRLRYEHIRNIVDRNGRFLLDNDSIISVEQSQ